MSATRYALLLALAASPAAATGAQSAHTTAGVAARDSAQAVPTAADQQARLDSIRADSVLEARTAVLGAQLRCAVCQGISIQESPSSLAKEMRDVVKEQLRAGRTEEEVKEYFVSKYGEWILLEPRAHGLNLLLYALPVLLLVGGLVVIAVVVRRWSSPRPPDVVA